ncbi:DUF6316 family protein [Pleionea sp. CnH1-48]|uniref:DUF6316 family protein n=1 Tax=Pleionea sp. CnH1-48 TaxID=2954494 RepID=UPI002096AF2A|nr:DUF6316 family protein [Pleionea sp. CnH1-48]MCO7226341.1 DUF6316 family protein [Pleionea sp. CnH1-48]
MDVSAQYKLSGDRVFQEKQGWFFATREGIDMGPFPDRNSAELELSCYATHIQKKEEKQKKTQVRWRTF